MLDIAGCIVTIDAIGCQKEIVNLISQKDGDYIIALKKNQKSLYESTELLFKEAISKRNKGENVSHYSSRELGHGREEIRNYLMLSDVSNRIDPDNKWNKLNLTQTAIKWLEEKQAELSANSLSDVIERMARENLDKR